LEREWERETKVVLETKCVIDSNRRSSKHPGCVLRLNYNQGERRKRISRKGKDIYGLMMSGNHYSKRAVPSLMAIRRLLESMDIG